MNIPKVLGAAFFIEQLQWLLLNYVLVSEKNFKKKKVSGQIAKSKQAGQLPQQHLSFLQNLLNFLLPRSR